MTIKSDLDGEDLFLLQQALLNYVFGARAKGIIIDQDWKKTQVKLEILLAKKGCMWAPGTFQKPRKCKNCKKTIDSGYELPNQDIYGTGYTNAFVCPECMAGFLIE